MSLTVARRDARNPDHDWAGLLGSLEGGVLFQSPAWVDLLLAYLPAVEDETLVALADGRLAGALPMLVKRGPAGAVANSLPYFGSNGAFIIDPRLADGDAVREALWRAWLRRAEELEIAVTVLIDDPFQGSRAFLEPMAWEARDERVGHLTPLGAVAASADPAAALMELLHSKTRNMVRKAQKEGVSVVRDESAAAHGFLQRVHEENLAALGGRPKDERFFGLARARLETSTYLGLHQGSPVAALFLVRHGRVQEYFTPAVLAQYRSLQPLSAVIFQAMLDSAAQGARWWNWGGSWPSQESLQTFKSRWGTRNEPYGYYVKIHRPPEPLRELGAEGIIKSYPYFYVLPFDTIDP